VAEDGDIFGEGVNVAARLQALANPDDILISGKAYTEVEGKLYAHFEHRGERRLKNISKPVSVYAVSVPQVSAADIRAVHKGLKSPTLPNKPSVAVLPFENMSGDPEQEYFADGIVEDIITALSRIKWIFVIARNSSFAFKGKSVDVRQIGRELGVRYLVEGSIRKSGSRIRITGQLIDAETGNHIWADRFDRSLGDVFELQDEITLQIASAIEPNLQSAEVRRATLKRIDNLNAYDLYLRALASYYTMSREGLSESIVFARQAIEVDPAYDLAKAFAAYALAMRNQYSPLSAEELGEAINLAKNVLAASRDDPRTISYAAHALSALSGEHDLSLPALERALRINPNSAHILVRTGWVKAYLSDPDAAIDLFLQSARLDPLNSEMGFIYCGLFVAYLMKGEHKQALEYAQQSVEEMPRLPLAWRSLSIALVQTGQVTEAREAMKAVLGLSPDLTLEKAKRTLPFKDISVREIFIRAYRQAGLT